MLIVLWTTEDGKEHFNTFGDCERPTSEEDYKIVEQFCKKRWQESVTNSRNHTMKIRHMSVFSGTHVDFETKKVEIVEQFKLFRDSTIEPK